jgi:aspartyl-tRNA(Asn)/glutamyl-tRNA(Gln) amidotransferase subunit C
MTLTRDDVTHVAMLARLGLSDEEIARFGAQLDAILQAISRLNQVDTSAVAETAQVGGLVNVWREDEPRPSISREQALANAPDSEDGQFRVGAIQE